MRNLIVIFALVFSMNLNAQERADTRTACHKGNIDVRNGEDMEFLQSQWCVDGSVFINGLLMLGNEVFESLDLGSLRSISGVLIVRGNPRLKAVTSKLRKVAYIDFSSNPMLTQCRAELFALRAGVAYRWGSCGLNQGCGLLQWEQEELEALREYYGIY